MVLTPTACVQLVLELLTLLSGAKSALQWAEAYRFTQQSKIEVHHDCFYLLVSHTNVINGSNFMTPPQKFFYLAECAQKKCRS